jgi:SAM-dependent methyltransferase
VSGGAAGWDEYAPYYDWENAQTIGRSDLPFWRRLVADRGGPVLELGCGTGRILAPVARAGVDVVGVDRSAPMLARAQARIRRAGLDARARLVRGDITRSPFRRRTRFAVVIAAYGILQSLLEDAELDAALAAAAGSLQSGGTLAADLVPDLIGWREYERRQTLSGRGPRRGATIALVESVRHDRARGLTIFDEEFVERRGRSTTRRRFSLTFRTRPMEEMTARFEAAGLTVETVAGDYDGGAWTPDAPVWLIVARKRRR